MVNDTGGTRQIHTRQDGSTRVCEILILEVSINTTILVSPVSLISPVSIGKVVSRETCFRWVVILSHSEVHKFLVPI